MQYKLIYFFGADGTGKTTHADLTSLYLKEKGYRVWRASVKQHHTLSYLLLKLLHSVNACEEAINYRGFDSKRGRRIKTPWKILELVSLLPAVIYRVFLPSLLGYIVICDRYVLDTLVTLSYFLNEPELVSSTSAKLLVKLIPKSSLLIYLDADTEVILERKRSEPLTTQLIGYYKKVYGDLFRLLSLSVITIDTSTTSVEDTQEIVLQWIRPRLHG